MCVFVHVSIHGHAGITNAVRSSEYFQSMLPLSAECLELDGDCSSLPIIFEDTYTEQVITSLEPAASRDHSPAELRRPAAVKSEVSRVTALSGRSHGSLASSMSSASDVSRRFSKLRLKTRPESMLCGAAGDGPLAADEQDCTLVGYRKIDISSKDLTPTVELGTLTTGHKHTPALVGAGVIMQPSLLFNAVSLPTLTTAGATAADMSMPLTGSMPTLAANEHSSLETELTPYWISQQGKAQLVAQHSNEATALGNAVDFTLDSELDTTVGFDTQRAVGNDLYMADGVDLDKTLHVDEDEMALDEASVAEVSAESDGPVSDNVSATNGAPCTVAGSIDGDGALITTSAGGNSCDVSAEIGHQDAFNAEEADSANNKVCVDTVDADSVACDNERSTDNCLPQSSSSLPPSLLTQADNSDQDIPVTDGARDHAACMSCTDGEQSLVDGASYLPILGQSGAELKNLSTDGTGDKVVSGKSVNVVAQSGEAIMGEFVATLKKSSSDSEVISSKSDAEFKPLSAAGDAADELNVVIPSSCDSLSDDETFMSSECTLLEMITEGSKDDHAALVSTAMQQQERAIDIGDIDMSDTASLTRQTTNSKPSKRLISIVSDDTIQFIGAKEKLRKQLNYSGHFYRSVKLLV